MVESGVHTDDIVFLPGSPAVGRWVNRGAQCFPSLTGETGRSALEEWQEVCGDVRKRFLEKVTFAPVFEG